MKSLKSSGGMVSLVIAIAAALALVSWTQAGFMGKAEPSVLTEPVVKGSVEESVIANGVLEPARIVSVGAQVSGQLKALHAELGRSVKEGDLIAEIDSQPQANALRIAEAAFANVKAQRKSRGIQLGQAQRVYERQKMLRSQKAASGADLELAEATFKTLQADVEALEAQIAQATVEVENARTNLGYTKILAPMDGVVVAVVTKAGQTLNSNQAVPTIVVLAQLDVMRVKVQIAEADVTRVRPGQNVRFTIMGDKGKPLEARLEQIEPAPTAIAADSNTIVTTATPTTAQAVYYNGLFVTPNPDGRLRPMMTVVVTIVVAGVRDVPLVPWSALTEQDGDGRFRVQVLSPSGDIVERRVATGLTDKVKAQVVDGLAVGDEIVVPQDGPTSDSGDTVMM